MEFTERYDPITVQFGASVGMKPSDKHIRRIKDDSLYGLLSWHKSNYTYVRVLLSDEEDIISIQLADNPKRFTDIPSDRYRGYRMLRRLEIGVTKISLKYLTPKILVSVLGPLLEINIPVEKVMLTDNIAGNGYYIIETSLKYRPRILQAVKKIINMSPQKRYEILEKYLAGVQD